VARLTGTNEARAREILAEHELVAAESMDDAVQKAVELSRRGA
jgi:succinyl-CoA synthetase beta subunit